VKLGDSSCVAWALHFTDNSNELNIFACGALSFAHWVEGK